MATKKKSVTTSVLTGKVTSVTVKGRGKNSGDVQFTLPGHAFLITAPPIQGTPPGFGYETYTFTSMASLVTAAYFAGAKVTVEYVDFVDKTDEPISIKVG